MKRQTKRILRKPSFWCFFIIRFLRKIGNLNLHTQKNDFLISYCLTDNSLKF